MATGWKCASCSAENSETAVSCGSCGLIRGGVVTAPNPLSPPAPLPPTVQPGWPAAAPGTTPGVPAPATRPPWRRIPLGWLVLAAIVGIAAIGGWYANASRSPGGEITKSGDLTAVDLRTGDCFDLKDPTADQIDTVTGKPCTEAHEYEVFLATSMPPGAYPTDDEFQTFVSDTCTPEFQTFVGRAYADSALEIFWFYPSTEGWASGDRSIQCAVYHPSVPRLTQSLKGSDQ